MKKISLLIILSILAIVIAASANMKIENQSNEFANAQVQDAVSSNAEVPHSAPDTTTISVLLGVGIIGMVTFSRRR